MTLITFLCYHLSTLIRKESNLKIAPPTPPKKNLNKLICKLIEDEKGVTKFMSPQSKKLSQSGELSQSRRWHFTMNC